MYVIYYIENNNVCCYTSGDKEFADKYLGQLKDKGFMIATNYNGIVDFANSCETDWFIPIVEAGFTANDWREEDAFLLRVLMQWEENMLSIKTDKEGTKREILCRNKRYILTKDVVKVDQYDAQIAQCPDKYMQFTFWAKDMTIELSSYNIEM